MTLTPPILTTEAEDIRSILDYLGLSQSCVEAGQITGLSKSAISEVLAGKRRRPTARRRHIAVVAALTKELATVREAATGRSDRGASALGWLHAGAVQTQAGVKTPLEILSDTVLSLEALSEVRR